MTSHELWEQINNEHAGFLFMLWQRWQDEKDFEDINDYLSAIQKRLPMAYAITKRPFGVKLKASDRDIKVDIKTQGRYAKLYVKAL